MNAPLQYLDRATGEHLTECVLGDGALRFAYETLLGRTLWPVLFGSKAVSVILGAYYDSRFSCKAIATLANLPGCVPSEAEKPLADYASFNEFFTRHLKPGARPLGDADLVSPADARLKLYLGVDGSRPFPLKGARRSLYEIFSSNRALANLQYDIAVFRLAPVDYHRFHFPFDCTVAEKPLRIKGKYHSVNPIALLKHPDIYADNERVITKLESAFGEAFMVDVGAFGVGSIVQTYVGEHHTKGEEKGFFKFGGSTVILVTLAGRVKYDADIVESSALGLEVKVRSCERLGMRV